MQRVFCLLLFCQFIFSCQSTKKLLFPLAGGKVINYDNTENFDGDWYIKATYNYTVKSAENGVVTALYNLGRIHSVVIKGHYSIMYSNLLECSLAEGDSVQKGGVIGRIPNSGYKKADAYLNVLISDQEGNFVEPKSIWKNKY